MENGHRFTPSITDLLLATLLSARGTRIYRSILKDRALKRYKEDSIKRSLMRLNRAGFAENTSAGWSITPRGRARAGAANLLSFFPPIIQKAADYKIIIAFDIPEKNRKVRNWLRDQIKIFDYKMMQQSLWIGPGPLPSGFIKRLEDLKISKNVKTLKVKSLK